MVGNYPILVILVYLLCSLVNGADLPDGFSVSVSTTSVTVSWGVPGTAAIPENFTVQVGDTSCDQVQKQCDQFLLNPGTAVTVGVYTGGSDFVETVFTKPLPTLPVISSTSLNDPNTELSISWAITSGNPGSGLTYMIQVNAEASETVTENPTILQNLTPGSLYTIALWSIAGRGTPREAHSQPKTAVHYTAPLGPVSVKLEQGNNHNRLRVRWTGAAINSPAVSYTVQLHLMGITVEQVAAASSPYQFTAVLKHGTLYTVSVWAEIGDQWSTILSDSEYIEPLSPSDVSLQISNDGINKLTLTFSPDPLNGVDVSYMAVLYDSDGNKLVSMDSVSSPHIFTESLTPGARYTVTVEAHVGPNSERKHSQSVNSTSYTVPLAPFDVVLSEAHTDGFTVTWKTPPNAASVLYKVKLSSVGVPQVTASPTRHVFGESLPLLSGAEYTMYVWAEVMDGSLKSAEKHITAVTVPKAPSITGFTKSSVSPTSSLILTWLEPAENAGAVRYRVRLDQVSRQTTTVSTNTATTPDSYTFRGLIPGAGYRAYIWAEAGNIMTNGLQSEMLNTGDTLTYTKPQTPSIFLTRDPTADKSQLKLSLTKPENDGGVTYWSRLGTDPVEQIVSEEKTFTGLSSATQYTVSVWAQAIPTEKSSTVSSSAYTAPDKPVLISVDPIDTKSIRVTWVTSAKPLVYDVYIYKDGMSQAITSACTSVSTSPCLVDVQTAFSVMELPGQKYSIQVEAKVSTDNTVRSGLTSPLGVNTNPLPPNSLNVQSRSSNQLVLKWTIPSQTYSNDFKYSVTPYDNISPVLDVASQTLRLLNLKPGWSYTVTINTIAGLSNSSDTTGTFYTKPRQPNSPTRIATSTDSLQVMWSMPPDAGVYEKFIISIHSPSQSIETDRNVFTATFNDLTAGTGYSVQVVSEVNDIRSDSSNMVTLYTKPNKPQGLKASEQTTTSIKLSWSSPAGMVTRYQVKFGNTNALDNGLNTEKTFSRLSAGAAYMVVLYSEAADGSQSDPVTGTFYTVPNVPRNLQEVKNLRSTTQVAVSWTGPDSGWDGYVISLVNMGTVVTLVKDEVSRTFAVSPGEVHMISLKARYQGLFSAEVLAQVTALPNPPRDLRLSGVNMTSMITLQWMKPDQTAPVDNYTYTLTRRGTTDIRSGVASQPQQIVSNLLPGATYDITVYASKNDVNSTNTRLTSVTLMPSPAENLVEGVEKSTTTSIDIMWSRPSTGVYDSFYLEWVRLYRQTIGFQDMTSTSMTISGLSPGQGYRVSVYAVSNGVRSAILSKIFYTNIAAVDLDLDSITSTYISISWRDPEATEVSHYTVYIMPGGPEFNISMSTKREYSHTFMNLVPGQTYKTTVIVHSAGGRTNSSTQTYTTYPLPVVSVMATTASTTAINLNWTVNSTSRQDGFLIMYHPDQMLDIKRIHQHMQTTITNLTPGMTYNFSINAYSNDVKDQKVNGTAIHKTATTRPLPVRNFSVSHFTQSDKSVKLAWSGGAGSKQDQYVITYSGQFVMTRNITIIKREQEGIDIYHVVTNLHPGEKYFFWIEAQSGNQLSDPIEDNIIIYPLPPSNVSISPSRGNETTSIPIQWDYDRTLSYTQNWKVKLANATSGIQVYTVNTKDNIIRLMNLTPGEHYTVHVHGVTEDKVQSSASTNISVTAKPSEVGAMIVSHSTTNNSLMVTYTPPTVTGVFDSYIFLLNDGQRINVSRTDVAEVIRFNHLEPGTVYTVQMMIQSGQEVSQPVSAQFLTNPSSPSARCGETTSSSITLIITEPSDRNVDEYNITCSACAENSIIITNANSNTTTHTLNGLKPYVNYTYSISSIKLEIVPSVIKYSIDSWDGICQTNNGPAGAVQDFTSSDIQPDKVRLNWNQSSAPNGLIRGYTITYIGRKEGKQQHGPRSIDIDGAEIRSTLVEDLIAGYVYDFSIYARNGLIGEKKTITVKTIIGAPALDRENNLEPKPKNLSKDENAIQWNKANLEFTNPFTNQYGDVIKYSIIVVTRSSDNSELDGDIDIRWHDSYNENPSPPYAAIHHCNVNFEDLNDCWQGKDASNSRRKRLAKETITIVIGGDSSCAKNSEYNGYCNGPLKPEVKYKVFLRGFTETQKYTDAAYLEFTTASKPIPYVAIIVPIVVGVAVIAFLIIMLLLWRNGTLSRGSKKGAPDYKPPLTGKILVSRPVKIEYFSEHFKDMHADSDLKFAEEYEDLRTVGRNQSCDIAELPNNRLKNRYVNILPYDHSRVKLLPMYDEGEGSSDYINASWVPGYNSKREFIVCQGPLPGTRDDHWRMIWEYNCRAIVMVTQCVEEGREKCDHYWPYDSEPMYYGDLQVKITSEVNDTQNEDPEYTITNMILSQGQQTRRMTHYHYLKWRDFNIPQLRSMANFVKKVRSMISYDGGPIVVHCSAGVGRSGTFIALDRLFQTIQEHDAVDIYGIVHEMRTCRPFMVQTEKQYVFIHECLKQEIEDARRGIKNNGYDDDGTENLYAIKE